MPPIEHMYDSMSRPAFVAAFPQLETVMRAIRPGRGDADSGAALSQLFNSQKIRKHNNSISCRLACLAVCLVVMRPRLVCLGVLCILPSAEASLIALSLAAGSAREALVDEDGAVGDLVGESGAPAERRPHRVDHPAAQGPRARSQGRS